MRTVSGRTWVRLDPRDRHVGVGISQLEVVRNRDPVEYPERVADSSSEVS
jgi:hypothetical protein